MADTPSWSSDDVTYQTFPGAYRFGGKPASVYEDNIRHETDSGAKFVYNLFSRKTFEVTFRLTEAQLATMLSFHNAVDGEVLAFYFSKSGAGSADAVYVRKEAGFDPQELDEPGGDGPMFDYVLRMEQEIV